MHVYNYKNNVTTTYTAVVILVENLWRQRVALLWLLIPGDVAVHPEPLLLPHGNVYFLEVDSVGLQETHHCLLMLLYLRGSAMKKKKSEAENVRLKEFKIEK